MYKRGSFHLLAEAYKQVIAPNRINAHNYDILKDNLAELAKVARVLPNKREAGYDDELEEKVDSLARVLGLIKRDNEEDYQYGGEINYRGMDARQLKSYNEYIEIINNKLSGSDVGRSIPWSPTKLPGHLRLTAFVIR